MSRHRRLQLVDGAFSPQQRQANPAKAVSLRVAAERLGMSVRTAERRMAEGTFPVPELPRMKQRRGSPHLFSSALIERYLETASTADVR